MTAAQGAAPRRAATRGVIVVTSTRTGSGGVPIGQSVNGTGAGDLNPQKARVLLALALTQTSDLEEIRKICAANQ